VIAGAVGSLATLYFTQPRAQTDQLSQAAQVLQAPQATQQPSSGDVTRADVDALNARIRKLATIQSNTLERLSEVETAQIRTQAFERATANAQRDLRLRLETLSTDFRRMPDTTFSEPGFPVISGE
jgi:hypothetical protein